MFSAVSARSGRLQSCAGDAQSFEPTPLPPDLSLSPMQWRHVTEAERALGQLLGRLERTRWPQGLVRLAALQEAVASSQLEGRHLTLHEALWWQLDPTAEQLQTKAGALRLTLEHAQVLQRSSVAPDPGSLHAQLYQQVQGRDARAGEMRSSLIWLGPRGSTARDAPFVPPAPAGLQEHVSHLTSYLRQAASWPRLVHAALVYYQVETINPFLDGSGRVARTMLLQLLNAGDTTNAMLLLRPSRLWSSGPEHFHQLQRLREHGNYEVWIEEFARSMSQCARAAMNLLEGVDTWFHNARKQLEVELPGQRHVATRLLQELVARPLMDVTTAAALCERNFANANILIQRLVAIGLLHEISRRRRNRRYVAPGLTCLLGDAPG